MMVVPDRGVSMRNLPIAFVLVSLLACGSSEEGGVSGEPIPGGDDGGLVADAQADTGTVDAGPEDAGPEDTGPEDTGAHDAGPEDTGPVDAGPEDTGPEDTGPVDTGPPDTGPKDTQGALCADYTTKFLGAADAAKKCKSQFSCTELAPACMGCKTCENYYSGDAPGAQPVWDVSSEATQKKCPAGKPATECVDPLKHVGVCAMSSDPNKGGTCTHDAPKCGELEKRAKAAIDEGMKCTADSECAFQAQTSLPCGCGAFMNIKTIGPGKPLMKYLQMLVKVYNAKKCFNGQCSCPSFSKAVCEKGVCKSLP